MSSEVVHARLRLLAVAALLASASFASADEAAVRRQVALVDLYIGQLGHSRMVRLHAPRAPHAQRLVSELWMLVAE